MVGEHHRSWHGVARRSRQTFKLPNSTALLTKNQKKKKKKILEGPEAFPIQKAIKKKDKTESKSCAKRESNPHLILGRDES